MERLSAYRPLLLVAEDDDDFRALLTTALGNDGFRVTAVATGTELFAELKAVLGGAEPPALVLSDERMPGMTGLRVLQQARAWGLTLPLVLITAFADRELAIQAGASNVVVLSKPFSMAELRSLVESLVPRTAAGNPASPGD